MQKSETELIQEVLSGNPHAYRDLIERHQARAYAMARRLIAQPEVAEDLVQDALVKGYQQLKSFRGEASFGTWLCRIVTTTCLAYLRKEKRKPEHRSIDQYQGPAEAPEGESRLLKGERQQMILKTLARLSPKERLVLQMFYLDEMSIEEICESTGFSTSNVKVLLHRGRKNFQTHYSPANFEFHRHES